MTNSLHRLGSPEDLKKDYIIFATTTKGVNKEGSEPKFRKFGQICLKYHPVNIGNSTYGTMFHEDIDIDKLIDTENYAQGAKAVFTDIDTLQKVIEELIQADLGLSIVVSGLLEEVKECCHRAGIERHSAEQSLGIWGAKDRLPEREIIEFNTMCGHGMVSFNFIRKMIEYVRLRRLTPKEASIIMARCCGCGAFNPVRAEILLKNMQERGFLYSEIRIDK